MAENLSESELKGVKECGPQSEKVEMECEGNLSEVGFPGTSDKTDKPATEGGSGSNLRTSDAPSAAGGKSESTLDALVMEEISECTSDKSLAMDETSECAHLSPDAGKSSEGKCSPGLVSKGMTFVEKYISMPIISSKHSINMRESTASGYLTMKSAGLVSTNTRDAESASSSIDTECIEAARGSQVTDSGARVSGTPKKKAESAGRKKGKMLTDFLGRVKNLKSNIFKHNPKQSDKIAFVATETESTESNESEEDRIEDADASETDQKSAITSPKSGDVLELEFPDPAPGTTGPRGKFVDKPFVSAYTTVIDDTPTLSTTVDVTSDLSSADRETKSGASSDTEAQRSQLSSLSEFSDAIADASNQGRESEEHEASTLSPTRRAILKRHKRMQELAKSSDSDEEAAAVEEVCPSPRKRAPPRRRYSEDKGKK